MSIRVAINSVAFSDETVVETPHNGIVAIVGPNNVGKTVSLHDILANLGSAHGRNDTKVIKNVDLHVEGSQEDLKAWVSANAHIRPDTNHLIYQRMGATVPWSSIVMGWEGAKENGLLGRFLDFVALLADVDNRLGVASGNVSLDYYDRAPQVPVHHLYLDGRLESAFSTIAEENFGHPLTLQRLGPNLRVRLGTPDAKVPPINRPTPEYAAAEAALPTLESQGHGMRSFLGLALVLLVQSYPVILIDEPEAFLHPPQRRSLGRLISRLAATRSAQVFIATHDTEFLWGLLDGPSDVTVIRLTRDGDTNVAKQVPADQARHLWTDPLLRYSRIFDGLFYDRVVVAESDADCRFYSAVCDYLVESGKMPRPDVLFVPAGGKDRMHVALKALRSVGVDCVAATDFDMLRDEASLRRLIESTDSDWDPFVALRRRFADAIGSRRVGKPISGIRKALDKILQDDNRDLDRDTSKAICELVAHRDGWEEAKRSGLTGGGVPSGDAFNACEKMIDNLESIGIYVCPIGELESFIRAKGGHGPKWVSEVLSLRLHETAEAAHAFVMKIVNR